ncbi:MAG: hypothetical protein KF727_14210 [Microbacteriaceae bacterium]|nr:hypothetical protein [Microbacteriaceae bacterium]
MFASWALTRALSPRDVVRVASIEADGRYSNEYSGLVPIDGPAPTGPWAMLLADRAGFHFLPFDLDASHGNAGHDAGRLSLWLDELNIDHLVVESGPSGGRHIWIALDEPAHPDLVRELAHLTGSLLPSLDKSPLCNPGAGAVRPPGAPHRHGGVSTVIRGDVATLRAARTTADDLDALRTFLLEAGAEVVTAMTSTPRGVAVDGDGEPYLRGARRTPSARIRELLDAPCGEDASRTQATVLAGLAHARWRWRDVVALLPHSPALEHARSRRHSGGRRTVADDKALRRLSADWRRAVQYVAANPLSAGGLDDGFEARAAAVVQAVDAIDAHAAAVPGRWGLDGRSTAQRRNRGRYSHRAVLRAVSLYALQAASLEVEVDIRRLAQDTGYGREACRLALHALTAAEDGMPWLELAQEASGARGATYRLAGRFSTPAEGAEWAQVTTPPAVPSPDRSWWITRLTLELQSLAHDVFSAPRSLGRSAGRIYTSLPDDSPATLDALARRTGVSALQIRRSLRRLAAHGLAVRRDGGWTRPADDLRDAAAMRLGVDGYLLARAARYADERATWAWWQAELTWLRKRGKHRRPRSGSTAAPLFAQGTRESDFPRYPRRDGKPDHAHARALVSAGALTPAPQIEQAAA